jgi:hypothetical protein
VKGLIAGSVELVGGVTEEQFAHLEEADVEDALVAEEEGIEGLQTTDRLQEIVLVPLLHAARHLLHCCPETPLPLFAFPRTLLLPLTLLSHSGCIGGELPGFRGAKLCLGTVDLVLGLRDVLLARYGEAVLEVAAAIPLLTTPLIHDGPIWLQDGPVLDRNLL